MAGRRRSTCWVPPAYTPTTGMVMEMGRVAGIRNNSPASKANVLVGDIITRIEFGPNNLDRVR